jgi:flagellar biosynthesis/type III secretory pathway chaperone
VETTYINILMDTLKKKIAVLDQLIMITAEQEQILSSEAVSEERLDQTISEKEKLIQQLIRLDDGFDKVYQNVKDAISENKYLYREQIIGLQELIKQVTENGTKLQAAEMRNKNRFMSYFAGRKKEIKNIKLSSRTANSYYKSVMNQQPEHSVFLDKKK